MNPIDIKFGIIAVRVSEEEGMVDILHFCGYEQQPTQVEFDLLYNELSTDEEFGLITEMKDIKLIESPSEIVDLYREMLETDPNWHESN